MRAKKGLDPVERQAVDVPEMVVAYAGCWLVNSGPRVGRMPAGHDGSVQAPPPKLLSSPGRGAVESDAANHERNAQQLGNRRRLPQH